MRGDAAWVSCVEVIRPFGSSRTDAAARMQATNVFVREEKGWRIVHHHSAPIRLPSEKTQGSDRSMLN